MAKKDEKSVGLTVISKPTHECNLSCGYCYNWKKENDNALMSFDTLRNMTEKIALFNGPEKGTHFIWHGGEPLLAGLDFYREAMKIQKSLGSEFHITNSIQSNGTLVDDEVLDFLEENKFRIGFSLDGPPEIHNIARPRNPQYGSRESFGDVMRGIASAKKRNIGGGAICVLNNLNIDRVDEIYSFFKDNDISVKFNPLIFSGKATESLDILGITPIQHSKAMISLFDLWFDEPEYHIAVDPFDLIIGNLTTGITFGCNYGPGCHKKFMSVGPTGDVYPCGRFDGIPDFYYGNINKNSMEEIADSPPKKMLDKRTVENVKGCEPCGYNRICNAGCLHNAYMVTNDFLGKDYYCPSYKKIFKHIETRVREELQKAQERTLAKEACVA